ncbi:putative minor capsid protein [Diplocloster hominis]|uniref:putative minor capsid protein n=1 Tax=Diplocloster hominis TaxID=3079010 RepID=UPI0031BB6E73
MRPIPKKLLIHAVMLHKKTGEGRWGDDQMDDGLKLTRVRMEPSSKVVRDKNNSEIQLAATLFFDCKNSRPKGTSFAVDNIIIFNDQKHRVQIVEPLYDGSQLHHYELGLVAYA